MCRQAVESLGLAFDNSFAKFMMPPGRGTVLPGVKDTVLIDSSYNANLGSVNALLHMFSDFPVNKKWVLLSDMLEQGKEEREEHEKLADTLQALSLEKIILLGPRTQKYTFEKLKNSHITFSFLSLKEVKKYMEENIRGGEAILFKGSQSMMLEYIIESLLKEKDDASKLPRRSEFWDKKRKNAE